MSGTQLGTGTTITFATSGFTAKIDSIDHDDFEREVIDGSHMGSVDVAEKCVGNLVNYNGFSGNIHFDPNETPPIDAAEEVITITFPTPAGGSSGAKLSGTGAMTKYGFSAAKEEKMEATFSVTWTTKPTWTASS